MLGREAAEARRFPRFATFRRGWLAIERNGGPAVLPEEPSLPVIVTDVSLRGVALMSAQASGLELWGESPVALEIGDITARGRIAWFRKDGRGAWIAGVTLDIDDLDRASRAASRIQSARMAREFGPT